MQVDLPPNYNLDEAGEFFHRIEDALESVKAELGLDGYLVVHGAAWGRMTGWFPDQDKLSPRQVTERIMEVLPEQPGVKY